jgi:flagellar biosynthesis/type III secretory pathway chaperone
MDSLFADLVALLRQEIEQYRHLLALTRRERGCIVRGELMQLAKVVRKKEVVSEGLGQLAGGRTSLLERMAEALGEPAGELTLARVAQMAPGHTGETLAALLAEFRGLVGRLVAANEVNRTLLERSLDFVKGSLDLFRTVASAAPTYGANGRIESSTPVLAGLNQTA